MDLMETRDSTLQHDAEISGQWPDAKEEEKADEQVQEEIGG